MLLDRKGRNEFYAAIAAGEQKEPEPVYDEAWSAIGGEAVRVGMKEGFFPMWQFVQNKGPFKLAKLDALPLTGEALALREEISRDVTLRLKEGRPSAFNSSSVSIEDEARAEWDGNPLLRKEFGDNFSSWVAYKKAERSGQIRISRPKIIRQEVTA